MSVGNKIRVLVAEDSVTVRELLVEILRSDPALEIAGVARHGLEAVEMCERLSPDIVTMDIEMPRMDGFEATKRIMAATPTPIVIISASVDVHQVEVSLQALRMGALAILEKPVNPLAPTFDTQVRRLIDTVKTMSQVKVITHRQRQGRRPVAEPVTGLAKGSIPRVVCIGASTGGPAALHEILSGLPLDFAAPIVVVQHIGAEFADGMVSWLGRVCPLQVRAASDGERLAPSTVYVGRGDGHIGITKSGRIAISQDPPINGFRPSATHLFESAAHAYGDKALGVILTGMGDDGAAGLRVLHDRGGRIIAQDEATSVVFGMPKAAIDAGCADVVLPLPAIAPQLIKTLNGEMD